MHIEGSNGGESANNTVSPADLRLNDYCADLPKKSIRLRSKIEETSDLNAFLA